jgi:hypothetical protein
MNVWVVALLLLTPVFAVMGISRNRRRVSVLRADTVELRVDEFGAHRVLADGREEGIDWVDLTGVEVLTAKGGPYGAAGGVVILCGDEEHGCLVPIDRIEDSGLAEALTRLPGFDMRRLLEALQETPPKRTVCWERAAS